MSALDRLAAVLHGLALAAWLAGLAAAGVAAANVFPTMRDLEPSLPAYAAAPTEDHWRYAAGEIMDGVFVLADLVAFVAAPLAALTLVWILARTDRGRWRPANGARVAGLLLATGVLAYTATSLTPGMNRALRAQWDAAKAGELEVAEAQRLAFDADHHRADLLYRVSLLGVLVALGGTFAAGVPRRDPAAPGTAP